MAKLDKSKDYGTIMGSDKGQCFVQNKVIFDAEGVEWVDPAAVVANYLAAAEAKAKADAEAAEAGAKDKGGKKAKPDAPAADAAGDQLKAQLAG